MNATLKNYSEACKKADSITECPGTVCMVCPGTNDGYRIEAFGKAYRFASIEDAQEISQLFIAIVAIGVVESL